MGLLYVPIFRISSRAGIVQPPAGREDQRRCFAHLSRRASHDGHDSRGARAYLWGFADTIRAGMEGRENPQLFFGRLYNYRGPRYFFPQ